MKKIKEMDYHAYNTSLRNAFALFLVSLAIMNVYFLFTKRYYMVSYIFFFVVLIYLSGFPLSYILHRKKEKFKCIKCGECCSLNFKLKKSDVERLEKGDIKWTKFIDNKWRLKKNNGYCIFLKEKNGEKICSIYKYRPSICRKWPFFPNPFSISIPWLFSCPALRKLIKE